MECIKSVPHDCNFDLNSHFQNVNYICIYVYYTLCSLIHSFKYIYIYIDSSTDNLNDTESSVRPVILLQVFHLLHTVNLRNQYNETRTARKKINCKEIYFYLHLI